MRKDLSTRKLDVEELARRGDVLSGELSFEDMPRLAALCVSPLPENYSENEPVVFWKAYGELRPQRIGAPEIWLFLNVPARLPLRCQRCLKAVDESFDLELSYRFVATEEQAVAEDEESMEDVLVLTRSLDLLALCEDELIMALPLVALHEVCPDPLVLGLDHAGVALEVDDDSERDNAQGMQGNQDTPEAEGVDSKHPFAALEALRKKLH